MRPVHESAQAFFCAIKYLGEIPIFTYLEHFGTVVASILPSNNE